MGPGRPGRPPPGRNLDTDGMIPGSIERGSAMDKKQAYEKPEMKRLGLLRKLTKFSFNGYGPS